MNGPEAWPMRWRVVAALAAASCHLGCAGGSVVRLIDGIEVRGRFIDELAYAAYAHGAEAEARGNEEEALRHFLEAADHDPDSADIWTRVGALRCRLRYAESDADDAFARAEELDPEFEPLWRGRAECAALRGQREAALAHAALAVRLDPEREETILLYARLLDASGKRADAERWLRSLAARTPHSAQVWQAVAQHARLGNDEVLLAEAEGRIASMRGGAHPAAAGNKRRVHGWALVDEAIQAGELELARQRARQAHLDVRRLAARAILAGRPELAALEARLRLRANPDDTDARVALALAEDLAGRPAVAGELMVVRPDGAEPLSEIGRLLYAELLLRHAGLEAASDWLGVEPDELAAEGAVRVRLRQSFAESP